MTNLTHSPTKGEEVAKRVYEILGLVGEDPERDGLLDTPKRVAKAWDELLGGYHEDPDVLFKSFDREGMGEMVIVKEIPFASTCEHHMLPFTGYAHIGYVPGDKILGLSKLARLVDVYARRLQVQERLTAQVADKLMAGAGARGCMVVMEADHTCMTIRGVQKPGSLTITSAVRGVFSEQARTRDEFLALTAYRGGR